jgi:Arc/MetJ family transcription regulator
MAGLRTNIDIDDDLLSRAMAAAGLPTKKAAVEEGLHLLVLVGEQVQAASALKGIGWEGDLDAMREGRSFPRRERRG